MRVQSDYSLYHQHGLESCNRDRNTASYVGEELGNANVISVS